jgi:hypothetical protein
MNYKTLLMASAAVLFTSQAMAQDLTGAFSVPGKGQITSETSLGMSREKVKYSYNNNSYIQDGAYATEILEYGITDNFSINAGITNFFDKDAGYDLEDEFEYISYNNDHNFAYQLGAKYNMRFEDLLFQVAGTYNTWNPKDFYGHQTDMRWQKSIDFDLKAGLDLGNGITPYIIYSIESDIDTAHRELTQSVSAGVHKYAGKWALDGAIRYEWTKNGEREWFTPKKNTTETWLDVAGDYYLKDNIALGIYGNYLIDDHDAMNEWGDGNVHTNFNYEIGIRVKVLF